MSLADFNASFLKLRSAYADSQLKALLAQESERLFPNGTGSNRLLHDVPELDAFPRLIVRNANGDWGLSGRQGPSTTLADNGKIDVGMAGHSLLFHLRKPDSLPAGKLYADPAQLIDQLAKTGFMRRNVGSERVRITGFGKPSVDEIYTDRWQRHWQVRVWSLPYANGLVITYSLPVPDGYATLMQFAQPADEHDHLIDMRALTDFVQVAYAGTLAQWRDYLQQGTLLPALFKGIRIEADYGKRFSYASQRLDFGFDATLQKIKPDSMLRLGLGFFQDHGKVVWGVGDVMVKAAVGDPDRINIERHVQPSPDLDDNFKNLWNKIVQGQHPYDGTPYASDGEMRAASVIAPPAGTSPEVRYTVFYGVAGSPAPAVIKEGLGKLMKAVHVADP